VDNPARIFEYETLDGKDMEVAVNADRSGAHDRPKE